MMMMVATWIMIDLILIMQEIRIGSGSTLVFIVHYFTGGHVCQRLHTLKKSATKNPVKYYLVNLFFVYIILDE